METIGKLFIFIFTLLALAASVDAQSPREQLQQMVEQLQKTPNDNALRERIIKLATSIKPTPAIPEEAREPFVMGATVLKKASDPAGASKAVDLFTQALTVAPWFAEAYYNRALARETAGQFESAIDDLKLYLEFKLTDAERREAQDKIYSLKADAQLASAKKSEEVKAVAAKAALATAQARAAENSIEGAWFETLYGHVTSPTIIVTREDGGFKVKMIDADATDIHADETTLRFAYTIFAKVSFDLHREGEFLVGASSFTSQGRTSNIPSRMVRKPWKGAP